ncbi:Uncharacterized protein yacP [Listeria monocytogenes N53-1]|nr:Uncharacterized protein yacP [Listeria monocytogenes N53-1]
MIEQKAIEWKNVRTQIMVATSDYTEQWAIFGQGENYFLKFKK